jgi:hypothetical protein
MMDFKIPVPSKEEMDARLAKVEQAHQKNRDWVSENLTRPEQFEACYAVGEGFSFNTLSLPGWLEVARLAGVPHIPAREILSVPHKDFEDEPMGETPSKFSKHEKSIIEALQPYEMVRMEQVAPPASEISNV